MADNDEYSSDSDDEDYVPIEGESDGKDDVSSDDDENKTNETEQTKGEKRTKKQNNKTNKRTRRAGTRTSSDHETSDCSNDDTKDSNGGKVMTQEEEKNLSDSLWSDFLKDTNQASKKNAPNGTTSNSTANVENGVSSNEKKEITKVFNFAGETVKVKELVTVNEETKSTKESEETPKPSPSVTKNKPAGGGLGSILGKISGKGTKLSTLEKSKLDWNEYKSEEGIEEELHSFNKGKDGYLDRQAFLQRADLRQFEIEKNLRSLNRR